MAGKGRVENLRPPVKGERRGGRRKGSPNKKTSDLVRKASEAGLLPHEWLAAVMRGDAIKGISAADLTIERRIECAIAAAPYFAAKRKEISGPGGGPIATVDYSKMSAAQLEALEPVLASLVRAGA